MPKILSPPLLTKLYFLYSYFDSQAFFYFGKQIFRASLVITTTAGRILRKQKPTSANKYKNRSFKAFASHPESSFAKSSYSSHYRHTLYLQLPTKINHLLNCLFNLFVLFSLQFFLIYFFVNFFPVLFFECYFVLFSSLTPVYIGFFFYLC